MKNHSPEGPKWNKSNTCISFGRLLLRCYTLGELHLRRFSFDSNIHLRSTSRIKLRSYYTGSFPLPEYEHAPSSSYSGYLPVQYPIWIQICSCVKGFWEWHWEIVNIVLEYNAVEDCFTEDLFGDAQHIENLSKSDIADTHDPHSLVRSGNYVRFNPFR